MIIFKKAAALQEHLHGIADIGFIPTMGALHAGHRSLLEKSRADGRFSVVSIFVNPTQFNDITDLDKYPVTTEADIALLTEAGCDILFLPTAEEVYPKGAEGAQTYDFGLLDTVLEGAHRPGHFKGVGQVVARLLSIVKPHYLYMGQKDFQQCAVIKMLIKQMGLGDDISFVQCPTTRADDGLALSSRNRHLSPSQRSLASVIYQCLVSVQSKQNIASFAVVQKECHELLLAKGFEPEYIEIADAGSLVPMDEFDKDQPTVVLIAAWLGGIRLIDNILLDATT